MGLFNRETTIVDETISKLNNEELKKYLNTVKDKKIKNPFKNDEFLCEVILRLDEFEASELGGLGDSIDSIIRNFSNFFQSLTPLNEKTTDYEFIQIMFLNMISVNGINHYKIFDKSFYNMFTDKEFYQKIMDTIIDDEVLIQEFENFKTYIIQAKEYYNDKETFETHLFRILNETKSGVSLTSRRQSSLINEAKKRVGIYPINDSTLATINKRLNGADSVFNKLNAKIEEASKLSERMDTQVKEIQLLMKNLLNDITAELSSKAKNAIADFTEAYNKYLLNEKNSLTIQKDAIIRDLMLAFEKKVGELKGISESISKNTTFEISRVREEGDEILGKLEKLIKDNPELKRTLESYKDNADFMKSMAALESIIKNNANTGVIADKVEPRKITIVSNPKVIYFFDKSIKYQERWEKLMEAKKIWMDTGEIFHEKFDDILSFVIQDKVPYLWGASGCGKTYILKQIATLLRLELHDIGKVNESYDITGSSTVTGGYNYPLFFQGYANGGIVLADEIDGSRPDSTTILNNFISNNKSYNFPYYGVQEKNPNFRLVTAGNTRGMGKSEAFNGRWKMEESLQQRLKMVLVGYDNRIEERIFGNKYKEWYLFNCIFREATDEYSKMELEGDVAPGIFTTRDAADTVEYLDNKSFTPHKIIEYEFVQSKTVDYLTFLKREVETRSMNSNQKVKELSRIFSEVADQSIRVQSYVK